MFEYSSLCVCMFIYIYMCREITRGVIVIIKGNRHNDLGSNPGQCNLHCT